MPRTTVLDGTKFYVAHIVDQRPNPTDPSRVIATVDCPICGNEHDHGIAVESKGPIVGHRIPHCPDIRQSEPELADRGYLMWKDD